MSLGIILGQRATIGDVLGGFLFGFALGALAIKFI